MCLKLYALEAPNEMQAGLTNLPRFQGGREIVRTRLYKMHIFSYIKKTLVLLDLLDDATGDKHFCPM